VPQTEALLERFRAAHTQVLGVSVDSVYSHASWGASLGGISFPLLADFHPKGEMARSYGVYLDQAGITDRATIVIDSAGVVRYAASVSPSGQRDIAALAAECERVDALGTKTSEQPRPKASPAGVLYVRSNCGPSRFATWARENLHLGGLELKNVSEDPAAKAELEKVSGGGQAPCLVVGGKPTLEHVKIIEKLVAEMAPL
jgi:hypothetical protein